MLPLTSLRLRIASIPEKVIFIIIIKLIIVKNL